MLRWNVSFTSSYMWPRLLLVCVLAPFSICFQVVTWLPPAVPGVNEADEKVTLEPRTTFNPLTYNQQMQEADVRVIANAGDIAILKCHVVALSGKALNSSSASHVYAWRKFGKEAPIATILQNYPPRFDPTYSLRIDVVDGVNLRLSEVDETDTGMYECSRLCVEGGNSLCQDGKVLVALKVNTPPVLRDKSPSLTFVNDGDSVDLFCEVAGVPEPSHLWLKDGFQIFQSDRVQTTLVGARKNVARLLIKRFKKNTDAAVYSCHFWNFVGNVSHHMKVIVPEKHWILSDNAFIMTSPRNTTVMEGSRMKFICLSHGFPLNASQRWFFNGQNVVTVSSLKQRTQTFADGSLVISNIEKKDTGWYKCSPTNGLGRAPEAEAYLNVTYLPRVVNSPSKVYMARNLAGSLTCLVDANPPMNLIRWYKDNRPVDLSTHKHIRLSSDGVHLFLRPATVLDEGNYYCVPHSSLGQGEKSPTMQVLVKDPPYFILRPRPIYQRQPTQSVTMACQADGDPKPIIIWRKAEGEFAVPSKLLRMEGNLTVVNLSKEDHGYYECVASSPVADVVASTLVIIELTTPHPPTNVSAVPSKDHVHLSWFPAYDGGYPLHYLVWYRPVSPNNSLPWSTMRTTFSNLTYITIHQLIQDTEYEFVVFSRNNLGEGLCSDVIQVRTRRTNAEGGGGGGGCSEDCPSTITSTPEIQHTSYHLDLRYQEGLKPPKPINLTAKYVKSSLIISWSVPSFSDTNDIHLPIHHFSLQYRTVGQWVSLVERLMGTTSYNWTTASRGAVYQFRVIAHSKLPMELKFVPGEYSDVFVFQTGDPMHSDSPVTDQTLGAVIAIFFVSGILIVIFFVFLKKLCSRIHREKSRKGAESNSHRFPANASDHECSSALPETESLCKPLSKIKETPI